MAGSSYSSIAVPFSWKPNSKNTGSDYMNGNFVERSTIFPGMYEQPELGKKTRISLKTYTIR